MSQRTLRTKTAASVALGAVLAGAAGLGIWILLKGSEDASSARSRLPGFGETAYRVERDGRVVHEGCLLLAETQEQRSRGLMNVQELSGYDGMLFRFEGYVDSGFYMKDTPMPLSIAWLDAAGRLVSTADMEPCLDVPVCPTYHATGPYRYALEMPRGELSASGVGPGATVSAGGGC